MGNPHGGMIRMGTFIMFDGIGGSGKTTVAETVVRALEARGSTVFRQAKWEAERGTTPSLADVGNADVLFTAEPTKAWIGAAIRGELSRTDDPYDGVSAAHAFALDRAVLCRRLVHPALAAGKTVVQDRGVCTSLAYQSLMTGGLSADEIAALPGNQLALSRPPDVLVLVRVSPETAAKRLASRSGPTKGVYGNVDFLARVARESYETAAFRARFERLGTRVLDLDAEPPADTVASAALALLADALPSLRS